MQPQPPTAAPQVMKKSLGVKLLIGFWGIVFITIISYVISENTKPETSQASKQATSSTPASPPATSTSAPTVKAPELSSQERLRKAKESLRSKDPMYYMVEELLSKIPESDPAYKEAKPLLEQARKKMAENEGVLIRGRLRDSYRSLIAGANPHLNYIESKITKIRKGYAIFAQHEFFTQYSFSAGDEAKLTSSWIDSNRAELEKAKIAKVGLMGKGPYSSSCWLELNY